MEGTTASPHASQPLQAQWATDAEPALAAPEGLPALAAASGEENRVKPVAPEHLSSCKVHSC